MTIGLGVRHQYAWFASKLKASHLNQSEPEKRGLDHSIDKDAERNIRGLVISNKVIALQRHLHV